MRSPGHRCARPSKKRVERRPDQRMIGAVRNPRPTPPATWMPDTTPSDPLQAIADLQRELAQARAERDEALAQQTATAEVLQVINASPGDLAPVFDAILERAHTLCGAVQGAMYVFEGENYRAVATRGLDAIDEQLRRRKPIVDGVTSGPLLAGERFVHISNLAEIGHFAVEAAGTRTLLSVPLRKGDALLGMINAARPEVRPFSDREIALLENFAAQAVIAMENARLITETREALEQQTATTEVLQVINASPGDLAPVFDAMLEKAIMLCEAAFGALNVYDGEWISTVASRGMPAELVDTYREPRGVTPAGSFSRFLRGEPLVHISDLAADEAVLSTYAPMVRAWVEAGGVRTTLELPLRKDDALLGSLWFYRTEVRPFTDKQIALLQNFAAQAVIAMENARLIIETREALEQQTATAEVLQVINSSPGDLAPVFDAVLEKALSLCDASYGGMYTHDGEQFHPVARRGDSAAFREVLGRELWRAKPNTGIGRLARGERIVQIADLTDTDEYRARDPIRVATVELLGAGSCIWVALIKDDVLLGALSAHRREVRPFTDRQIALLQNFAAQAVIAIENARLITETREALEQQTATAEVLQVINSSPSDLAPVFDAMLEKALTLCGAAFGQLNTYDGEGFRTVAVQGEPRIADWLMQRGRVRPGPGTTMDRLSRGEAVVQIADVTDDEGYRRGGPTRRALVEIGGCRTMLSVALRKDDALLGAITVYRQEVRPFSDKQIALLQNFAAQAVIAIENARLITETREALEQQTATTEVLQVINSSPGDLAPVFEAMLEKALRLCGGTFGNLLSYDGELFHVAASVHGDGRIADRQRDRSPFRAVPGGLLAAIAGGKQILFDEDILRSTDYRTGHAEFRQMVDSGGYRSVLNVALQKESAFFGTIGVFRTEVQPFTEKQIALLQNFATQAVIAMENARLITETREALEQQTATAEVLGVINSSPGDLAPVFDAILQKAHALCGAAKGALVTYDGERFRAVATRGLSKAYAVLLRAPQDNPPGSPPQRLLDGESLVQVPDMAALAFPIPRAAAQLEGIRSVLYVPLRKDGVLLGFITAYRQEVRSFSEKQIALLQNFAAQAVIAMENARLITETREALEQQTATAEVLRVINSSPGDLAPVFDAMLERATRLCEAEFGFMRTYNGDRLHLVAARGVPATYAEWRKQNPLVFGPDIGPARILAGERVVHNVDLKAGEAYARGEPNVRALVDLAGARSDLLVPLLRDDAVHGIVTIFRQEVRPFSDKQIALLQNFAAQAVIAIENARLLEELRARTDEIAGWNRELEARVAAQLAEIERTGKLRRFLAPQLADLILAQGDESILESHRREIVVVFCDLRGFTAFAERAEPEEVMALLKDYHAAMGPIVARFEGTIDHYGGDGIMVFFNDPPPTPDPAQRAIAMAVAMRAAAQDLLRSWRRHGHDIGFGVGISQGYATLGQIGFAERMDYTAIGTVTNLAARLCAEARTGRSWSAGASRSRSRTARRSKRSATYR